MFRLLLGGIYLLRTYPIAKRIKNESFDVRYHEAREASLKFLRLVKTSVLVNEQELPEGETLFVSNHQGTIDPLVIVAAIKKPTTFISKKENKKIPIISTWAEVLDLIYFDREDQSSAIKMLREASRWLKAGNSVLIFPEGTRSKSATVHGFHEASLKPAYLAKANIVPITLHNVYKDFDNIKTKTPYRITIGKPLSYEDYKDKDLKELADYLHDEIENPILNESQS
ncbi:MAG: lysophospholipid acyltransferase family protein [Anaerorhabdus sp.]|uniref:lysophospholipid acyltransferase family protein n=1 Tax=Anaerorhabdus sp. TaxID=1872524 RepID=UPI002FC9EC27